MNNKTIVGAKAGRRMLEEVKQNVNDHDSETRGL